MAGFIEVNGLMLSQNYFLQLKFHAETHMHAIIIFFRQGHIVQLLTSDVSEPEWWVGKPGSTFAY